MKQKIWVGVALGLFFTILLALFEEMVGFEKMVRYSLALIITYQLIGKD